MTQEELRGMWNAQIYCGMILGVKQAGYNSNAAHVDEVLKRDGWTVESLYEAVMAYTAHGAGVRG